MSKQKTVYILIILVLSLIPFSCSRSLLMELDARGNADITLDPETMRTSLSGLETDPVSYRLEGTHSSGINFDITTAATTLKIPELQTGDWELLVSGYDSNGEIIGQGTGSLTVTPGRTVTIIIVLYDTTGSGSLDFSLQWTEELLVSRSLNISLTTLSGTQENITYTETSGSAAGITTEIPSGFYKLNVQLLDGAVVVMGTVDIVLIQTGVTTTVNLDFTKINKQGERINLSSSEFTISWNSDDLTAERFNIYYREHGTFNWTLLGATASGSILSFTIDQTILPYGTYDFAVSSVAGGVESELHTSMDDTAVPATGWYIQWSS